MQRKVAADEHRVLEVPWRFARQEHSHQNTSGLVAAQEMSPGVMEQRRLMSGGALVEETSRFDTVAQVGNGVLDRRSGGRFAVFGQ
ncbi:MAG: hypothetical protein U5L74_01015 [Ideonella sp.]|nr:hypothetical protein [Ideonella sp.]